MPSLWNDAVNQWLCLEPDPALSRELDDRISNFKARNVRTQIGTIDDLQPNDRFDCILYIDVLEHIRDDRGELKRAADYLAPGGHLVVLSPAFQFLFSAFDTALGHERRYTAKSLAAVFPHWLQQERVFYADSVGALLSLSNRLLLRKELPTLKQITIWDRGVVPVSRVIDPIFRRLFGRSVIAIYKNTDQR